MMFNTGDIHLLLLSLLDVYLLYSDAYTIYNRFFDFQTFYASKLDYQLNLIEEKVCLFKKKLTFEVCYH